MAQPALMARMNAFVKPDEQNSSLPDPPAFKRPLRQNTENHPPVDQQLSSRPSLDTKPISSSRRQSGVRDYRPPQGPRPLDFSKRVTSEASSLNVPAASRSMLPNAASEPFLGLSGRRNAPPSEPAKTLIPDRKIGSVKRPAVSSNALGLYNSDDLLSNGAPRIDQPIGAVTSARKPSISRADALYAQQVPARLASHQSRLSTTSPVRHQNAALQAAQLSTAGTALTQPQITKTRRQSQFPPSTFATQTSKQPRKSIGPGSTSSNTREVSGSTRTSSQSSVNATSSIKTSFSKPRASAGSTPIAWAESDVSPRTTRSSKTQSMHAPKHSQNPSSSSRAPSEQDFPFTLDARLQSGISAQLAAPTISSASKRQSSIPAHAGGILARTVSPTDARRSKRVSAVNHPPPMPSKSPGPESHQINRPVPTPPPPSRKKSSAPCSPVVTPEVTQTLTASRELSSRSSYGSLRLGNVVQTPLGPNSSNQSFVTKPRSASQSDDTNMGFVPPVPAIPKAYESPNETKDQPFFTDIMNALELQSQHFRDTLDGEDIKALPPHHGGSNATIRQSVSSRRLTIANRSELGKGLVNGASSKRDHQPARLPPLNLLPLSNPTAAKIASLTSNASNSELASTPPPRKNAARTPTTPMTASRATFSSNELHSSFDIDPFPQARSSTSYGNPRSESSTRNGSYSTSSTTPSLAHFSTPKQGPSPVAEASIEALSSNSPLGQDLQTVEPPKNKQPKFRVGSTTLGRKASTSSKASKDVPLSNGVDNEGQGHTSIRRKLSMSWRRSSSKASHSGDVGPEAVDNDVNEMPPPKVPASSNFSASIGRSSKLLLPRSRSKNAEPDKSIISAKSSLSRLHDSSNRSRDSDINLNLEATNISPKIGTSLFSPMQKMLGARSSQNNLKAQPAVASIDRGDLAAEDEMKKLAAKRREFELAARELDELGKRATAKERVSPGRAAKMANLNIYERGEIIDHRDVYFCGTFNAKKFAGDLASQSSNFGFDDERGDYNIVFGDHLAYRYEVIDILGKGSFGQVVRCIDHKTGRLVAVKIIRNKKRFHQQALVEVNILQRLREWDPQSTHSMINFTQSFYFRGHLCISTELLGINLYEFIKAHDFGGFSLNLIRRFSKQILSSLCLLQVWNVIHCDLKPENILLAHPLRSEIKVIDFGSSCFETEKVYTYIQSRFYRSPEVILGMSYGLAIDMWSLGCILAELLTGYPIFPGENEQEQLACIMEVFGPPEKHLIERSTRKKLFFDSLGKPRLTVSSKGKRRRPSSKTLSQVLKCEDEAFLDFLTKCLRWDPDRRIKPDEAMKHDFITGMKRNARLRAPNGTNAASSPAKRGSIAQTPAQKRLLPDMPPVTSYKNGIPAGPRFAPSTSPIKDGSSSIRKSMFGDTAGNLAAKRASNGIGLGSALPRAQRSASGKVDLASAAAIASLVSNDGRKR